MSPSPSPSSRLRSPTPFGVDGSENEFSFMIVVIGFIAFALLIYLLAAMIWPEKF